jgi:hypothetical protein
VKFHEVGPDRRSWEAGRDYAPSPEWIVAAVTRRLKLKGKAVEAIPSGGEEMREGEIVVESRVIGRYTIEER